MFEEVLEALADVFAPAFAEFSTVLAVRIVQVHAEENPADCAAKIHGPPGNIVDCGRALGNECDHRAV
jgi:hypothetical protein